MMCRSTDIRKLAILLLPLALSACGPTGAPAPLPAPPPVPAMPVAVKPAGDWRDWPLAAGRWRYVPGKPVSASRYGDGTATVWTVQCDSAARRVTLMRSGTTNELVITTSSRTARFPAGHIDDHGVAMSAVVLNATDAFLDEMLFSRGRIAVESAGLSSLAIPTWGEPARAVEDCRK